ncbi:MAG: RagB/SusD family nutrient uptake outer membrane protein [Duncaniella sp.]|nr:RagB/SusD family nutrient uptake outer membrane protein [Duncaniella sp.]
MRPELSKALAQTDKRRLIYEGDLHEQVKELGSWTKDGDGYMCVKYVYTTEDDYYNTTGNAGSVNIFNSTDFPVFRLADTYLMLAECQLHGATGFDGLQYYNDVRLRAGVSPVGSYTADDLLKERLCELYWEGHRRSDLIRFGKFTGSSYMWSWKGGTYEGSATPEYRKLMAIPGQFVSTLGQNPGYPGGSEI